MAIYVNANTESNTPISLTGSVPDGEVFVIAHSSAGNTGSPLYGLADQIHGGISFNGNDTVVLLKNGSVVDSIGKIAENPSSGWTASGVSTVDSTLRRKNTVCSGDSNATDAFDPSTEWNGFVQNDFSGLGSHTTTCEDLAVDLADASSSVVEDFVLLEWQTASELDNRGFHLYRATAASGPWQRLNQTLIPSHNPGAVDGYQYRWEDRTVAPGTHYHYRIEALDLQGTPRMIAQLDLRFGSGHDLWLPQLTR